jgi:hypothetical protein
MSDRYDKIFAYKKMGLSKFNMLLAILSGAQNKENGIPIKFNFRPLMSHMCIFNSQIMQREFFLNSLQHLLRRLVQSDPNELTRVIQDLMNLVKFQFSQPFSVLVRNAIDDLFHMKQFKELK